MSMRALYIKARPYLVELKQFVGLSSALHQADKSSLTGDHKCNLTHSKSNKFDGVCTTVDSYPASQMIPLSFGTCTFITKTQL